MEWTNMPNDQRSEEEKDTGDGNKDIFGKEVIDEQPILRISQIVECRIPNDQEVLEDSDRILSMDEVRKALFVMGPLKAPRLDRFHALFYQSQWSIVRQSLVSGVQ
ncbi:hypothetical protein Ancab_014927 [Ancistrocladus abbreviatus]